jgi:hypothetical protein
MTPKKTARSSRSQTELQFDSDDTIDYTRALIVARYDDRASQGELKAHARRRGWLVHKVIPRYRVRDWLTSVPQFDVLITNRLRDLVSTTSDADVVMRYVRKHSLSMVAIADNIDTSRLTAAITCG